MRVLFVSGELIAGDLAYRLQEEGCDVRLYIEDKSRKDCFEGIIPKTKDWEKELDWVGKDGLIVFDDVGYGEKQDALRAKGYLVVGGSKGGDKLEKERDYCQKIFSVCGINPIETYDFKSAESALEFLKKEPNKKAWVLKQNGHNSIINYVGEMEDGSDILSLLESYQGKFQSKLPLTLQKRVWGIEIGVARYFNGKDWVGPIEINVEHKRLCEGDIGPLTGEMGTIIWYEENSRNRLFQQTLAKLKPYLQRANFIGDIDINCIVNKDKIFPLEVTARFGCPSTQLQDALNITTWSDFLLALAKGKNLKLKFKKGYGIVVSLAIPPFPTKMKDSFYIRNTELKFKKRIFKKEFQRIHFEEISCKMTSRGKKYCVAGSNGYIAYVTAVGKTIPEARKKAYKTINKLVLPRLFYRSDIGVKFHRKDLKQLKLWGWLSD